MKLKTDQKDIIMAVIRGEMAISHLAGAGIKANFDQDSYEITVEKPLVITPSWWDLMTGLCKLRKDRQALKQWASFILGASQVIDLTNLESCSFTEDILNLLWEASFNGEIDQAELSDQDCIWIEQENRMMKRFSS